MVPYRQADPPCSSHRTHAAAAAEVVGGLAGGQLGGGGEKAEQEAVVTVVGVVSGARVQWVERVSQELPTAGGPQNLSEQTDAAASAGSEGRARVTQRRAAGAPLSGRDDWPADDEEAARLDDANDLAGAGAVRVDTTASVGSDGLGRHR